ncbi:MAG: ATP-binding protein [Eggerthellaceae bacterium]|nr:ATP-binding protein [Eggerthellaceae bacterium]
MQMIPRAISKFTADNASWFPVVSVTGPRQSGKSTLVQNLFGDYDYENLELPGVRQIARQDPVGFISERPHKLIVDEAQLAPDLFSVIQVESDRSGESGQYVLSGSQNFLMRKQITQSLAGRVGMVKLLPLSYEELVGSGRALSADEFALRGGYPRLYASDIPTGIFFRNYVETYIERDVTGLIDAGNLQTFKTFLTLCAQSVGSLLNVTRLAADAGVSTKTARSWLSILEASYIVFRLAPYQANLRKQLTKTPKLYFFDTGLLCHLLGVSGDVQLRDSQYRGAVFENMVIVEAYKRRNNAGCEPQLRFYRDDSKIEVDLVDLTDPRSPELVEAKSSRTYNSSFTRHLSAVGKLLGIPPESQHVVMRADAKRAVSGVSVWPAEEWLCR